MLGRTDVGLQEDGLAAGGFDLASQSMRLRDTFRKQDLAAAANADIAAGRMVEIGGWVLPESVALLSALASRV